MSQLTLKIISSLSYSSENFLMHSGISETFRTAFALGAARASSIVWVTGAPRCGKTHFSVRLYEELLNHSLFPHIIEGPAFEGFLRDRGTRGPFSSDEVFIIDGADEYFRTYAAKDSGPVVSFFENARMARVPIVLLSTAPRGELGCDEHIMSRLRAGHLLPIMQPGDQDMPELIRMMARQRGILLTRKRVGFIAKRLARDVRSVEEYLNKVSHLSVAEQRPAKRPLLADAF